MLDEILFVVVLITLTVFFLLLICKRRKSIIICPIENNRLAGSPGDDQTSIPQMSNTEFKKVASVVECTDPLYPYFDAETSTCVQCFESSFNCLTGFQRCFRGRCVKKNSPQCAFYPIGLVGGGR
jgi:hypothetical protein